MLAVVGDVDPQAVIASIKSAFARLEAGRRQGRRELLGAESSRPDAGS